MNLKKSNQKRSLEPDPKTKQKAYLRNPEQKKEKEIGTWRNIKLKNKEQNK